MRAEANGAAEREARDAARVRPTARSPKAEPGAHPVSSRMLALQRLAGNAAVTRWLAAGEARDDEADVAGSAVEHSAEPQPVQRSSVHDVLASPGRPLDPGVRRNMESAFGTDFGDVRLLNDGAAQKSAREMSSIAYTSGNKIVSAGKLDDHTLAHELAHVVQQRQGPVAGTDNGDGLRVSHPDDRFEREAEATARSITANRHRHG
ncbi:DUF4157 domain-containing protein [Pseudonocardia alaniniphila]|uniref:DUF4157 domain-containing protein n=1 Tax=Pseudonocardia alaniniphila TaxID=75291 RepID=A0ABS9TBW9_9PSEU|nr:DUF4157 domain-containing protein [Pseudonocardia alaniniphila]MCH6166049.1 DUF4157 domain-containing protein [Pseudonocardia alaniniphila]